MAEALIEAERAGANPDGEEVPVGAVIVAPDGAILARAANASITDNDPTGHAEVRALRIAAAKTGNYRLEGCVLVVTLEPCLMCAGAIVHARLAGVVYGASDIKTGAVESCFNALNLPFHNHFVWHYGGIRSADCEKLLKYFFSRRR
jgi:tRNA(adenine34) deaminase